MYSSKVPRSWLRNNKDNTVFAPLHQSEALWLYFDGNPHKVKIYVDNVVSTGSVNGVTGKEEHKHEKAEQDYIGKLE